VTASDSSAVDIRIRSVRQMRRVANGAPFVPHGLLPALGLAVLLLFGLTAFAGGVESSASRAAREALDKIGATWARVSVSGQSVQLSGTPPSQAEAVEAIEVVRKASAASLFGLARPVTKVSQVFGTPSGAAPPARSAQASPATAPATATTAATPATAPASTPSPACDRAFADLLGARNVEFAPGSAEIGVDNAPFLDALARVAKTCPGMLSIQGYTDNSGTDTLNEGLSLDRAKAVRKALIERGLPEERVVAEGRGANDPIASNLTDAGRDRNRRIEILVQAPDAQN